MSTSLSVAEQNVATVDKLNTAVFRDQDFDAIADLVTDDFVQYGATREIHGAEGLRAYFESMLAAFPDADMKTHEVLADDKNVMFRFETSATNNGEIAFGDDEPIPATGKHATWDGMVLCRFEDGKIAETRLFIDNLSLYKQLGLLSEFRASA